MKKSKTEISLKKRVMKAFITELERVSMIGIELGEEGSDPLEHIQKALKIMAHMKELHDSQAAYEGGLH